MGTEPSVVGAVFVAGKARKWNGHLLDVDVEALHRRIIESRDYLLDRDGASRCDRRKLNLFGIKVKKDTEQCRPMR
ncbi:hypothetical protein [Nocardia africana]